MDRMFERRFHRILFVGAVFYSGLGLALNLIYPQAWDMLAIRLAISGAALLLLVVSLIAKRVAPWMETIARILNLVVTVHALTLVFANTADPVYLAHFLAVFILSAMIPSGLAEIIIMSAIPIASAPFLVLLTETQSSIWFAVMMIELSVGAVLTINLIRRRDRRQVDELRYLIEHADEELSETFWVLDRQKVIFNTNNLNRVFGVDIKTFTENPDAVFNVIYPEDKERMLIAWKNPLFMDEGLFDETFRIINPENEVRWIHMRSAPIPRIDRTAPYILGIAEDVTERKHIEEEIERLSETDALTGIYNRRRFSGILENEVTRSNRYKNKLSLIYFAVDDFAVINDTFGFRAGEKILKMIVDIVHSLIRDNDSFARWSDREFMILLPETDLSGAGVLADRLGDKFYNDSKNYVTEITCCFGVTEFQVGDSAQNFAMRAESALREAQNEGANHCKIAQ